MPRPVDRLTDFVQACERFVRDYTSGMRARDFRRLFDQDASQAFDVLSREHGAETEPEEPFRRFWHRARVVFLGLSYKLTPARRALFTFAMFSFVAGLVGIDFNVGVGVKVELSFVWYFLTVAALVFLLALELVDRIRVRDELEVARELQADLLPRSVPELPGYRISHAYRTANEVGGDYYDFSLLPDGRLALMVGDASGHGMAAGLLMAIANATLKMAIDLDPSPSRVLELLNRTLCRTGDRRAFMSIFYALLEPESGAIEYACAGHPFPLLRREGGEVVELGRGGLPLGFQPSLEFPTERASISHGDTLVLFSDGIPEGIDAQGESFGYERLQELVAEPGTTQAIQERILLAFDEHLGHEPLRDDFSLVVLGREATQ